MIGVRRGNGLVPRRGRGGLIDPGAASAEPFRTLRLALQLREGAPSRNALVITSAEVGEGKSTVACNYALVSSLGQHSVLLIDADLRSPRVHQVFGLARSPGLVDCLAEDGSLEDYVQRIPSLGHLDVLSAGRPIPRTGDLASSGRMAHLLQEARERYDVVVIDSPPVLRAADTEGIVSHAGTEVVVVVSGNTRRRTLKNALRKLDLIEANIAGLVVNRVGKLRAYTY